MYVRTYIPYRRQGTLLEGSLERLTPNLKIEEENTSTIKAINFGSIVGYLIIGIPYSYKFLRDIYFAVFMDNVWSTKIKSLKIYN